MDEPKKGETAEWVWGGLDPLGHQWRENKELGKQEESQHEPGGEGREGRTGRRRKGENRR